MKMNKKIKEHIWIRNHEYIKPIKVGLVETLTDEFGRNCLLVYVKGSYFIITTGSVINHDKVKEIEYILEIECKIHELESEKNRIKRNIND